MFDLEGPASGFRLVVNKPCAMLVTEAVQLANVVQLYQTLSIHDWFVRGFVMGPDLKKKSSCNTAEMLKSTINLVYSNFSSSIQPKA